MRAVPSSAGTVCALVPRESELEGSRFTELRKFALGWKINRAAGASAVGRNRETPSERCPGRGCVTWGIDHMMAEQKAKVNTFLFLAIADHDGRS